jgi:2-iminobutanoate/2-iminopropanoate deaminase
MNQPHNPGTVAAPISAYSHAVEVSPNSRWITLSGQIGLDIDGIPGKDVAEQSELIWHNIQEILNSAGMEIIDIVKMTAYLLDPADVGAYGPVKAKFLGEHRPASTLIYVSALATPEARVEVEVVAARAD